MRLRKKMANMFDVNWKDNSEFDVSDEKGESNYFAYYKLNDNELFAYNKQNNKCWKINLNENTVSRKSCNDLIPQSQQITQYQFETAIGSVNYYRMIGEIGR